MTQQVLSSAGAIKESSSFGNAGYGASLPSSPTDGMEYILVDSVSLPTYQWRMRYNAGSANTDKWEFVGGMAAHAVVATSESTASAAYTDLATAGPSITVPRAGVYRIEHGCSAALDSAGAFSAWCSPKLGSAAASDTHTVYQSLNSGAGSMQGARDQQVTLAASDVVKLQYKGNGGGTPISRRWLSITPVRLS